MRVERSSVPPSEILIVDDEPSILLVHGALLSSQGHNVVTACSGEEALAKVSCAAPDLIISDMMMANKDGADLARELRSMPEMRDVPIVLMSVREDRETRIRASEFADDFLVKPVDSLELLLRVRFLLKHRLRIRQVLAENARLEAENQRLKGY